MFVLVPLLLLLTPSSSVMVTPVQPADVPAPLPLIRESGKVWEHPCGTLPNEIFPEQVETYHLPWLARVGYEKRGRLQYTCTGSLIDRQHVLTAAHCVLPPRQPTRIQIRNCDSPKCEGSPRSYGVLAVRAHPEYSSLSTSFDHDIAVIRLDREVNLSVGGTRTVCLPQGEMLPAAAPADDTEYVVAGWRIHDNGTKYTPGNGPPRTVAVPPVTLTECQEMYGDSVKLTPELQLCAGGEGKEPCRGDAGAPLHALLGKRVVQIGLASFGLPDCSNSSLPTVYTAVKPHMDWIQAAVAAV